LELGAWSMDLGDGSLMVEVRAWSLCVGVGEKTFLPQIEKNTSKTCELFFLFFTADWR